MIMIKALMVVLFMALLFGCVTTAPQDQSGMKRISQIPGWAQAQFQSLEKRASVGVMGYGYICPTVTDIYTVDTEGFSYIATCLDGKTSTNYRFVESKDREWYSVTPTDERPPVSVEMIYQRSIYGAGFKCSKVTDIVEVKRGEIYQTFCIEGQYKAVKDKKGGFTVSPW
jgi:hypothetical protein